MGGPDGKENIHLSPEHRILKTLVLFSIITFSLFAYCTIKSIIVASRFDHSSGAFMTLAQDLAHGIFYRPIFSPELGYGGTRLFPLYFILCASLIKLGISTFLASIILIIAVNIIFLYIFYHTLVSLPISGRFITLAFALMASSYCVLYAFISPHCDLLATCFTLAGMLVATRRPIISGYGWLPVAACFIAAFATKETEVHGALAILAILLIRRAYRPALTLAGQLAIGYAAVLWMINTASSGRFLETLKVCASGGTQLYSIPTAFYRFYFELSHDHSVMALFATGMVIILFRRLSRQPFIWPESYFIASTFITAFLFFSPGIWINHFIDIQIASVLIIIITLEHMVRQGNAHGMEFTAIFILTVLVLVNGVKGIYLNIWNLSNKRATIARIHDEISGNRHSILSEDPVVPLLSSEPVYILDPFMLRIIGIKSQETIRPLLARIAARQFAAIVFMNDPKIYKDTGYTTIHIGSAIMTSILANYKFDHSTDDYFIYTPKTTQADSRN